MSKFNVGDRVVKSTVEHRINPNDNFSYGEKEAKKGQHGVVAQHARGDSYYVDWDNGRHSAIWEGNLAAEADWVAAERAEEPVEEAPERPTIDFSGDSRATSRDYAADSYSRKLSDTHQSLLLDAGAGKTVDALDFREAATAALSLAATRHNVSNVRGEYAKKARHLIHIADAVIRNHVDKLPAYQQGERSRLLEAEKERTTALIREKTALEIALEDEKERTTALIRENEHLRSAVEQATAELERQTAALDDANKRGEKGWAKAVDLQERLNEATDAATEAEVALAKMTRQYETTQENFTGVRKSLEQQVAYLQRSLNKATDEAADLEQRLQQYESLEQQVADLEAQLEGVYDQRRGNDRKVGELEAVLEYLISEVDPGDGDLVRGLVDGFRAGYTKALGA